MLALAWSGSLLLGGGGQVLSEPSLAGWIAGPIFGPSLGVSVARAASPSDAPRQHVVAKGHTLGAIAGRYAISIHALCTANSISRDKMLKPGMKLWIPPRSDKTGEKTRDRVNGKKRPPPPPRRGAAKKGRGSSGGASVSAADRRAVRWHTVAKGQILGSIAKRYGVSTSALTHANRLTSRSTIKPGQRLIVPAKGDKTGAKARYIKDNPKAAPAKAEKRSAGGTKTSASSWKKYARKPPRRGQLTLARRDGKVMKVTTLTKRGNVRAAAKKAFREMLQTRDEKRIDIDPRLIQLLTRVSDTFGGRRIRIVSGYRVRKTSPRSRHRHGRAMDFTIDGVPNTALRDFCKTLDRVGVGYYPNAGFIHLDARDQWTYWIDYSKPGQRPRYGGFWTKRGRAKGK